MGRTIDRLANPDHRDITTTYKTVEVGDRGPIMLVIETDHRKAQRAITSSIHTEQQDGIFAVRSFSLFGPESADGGVILRKTPVARFSRKVAEQQHADVLAALPHFHEALGGNEARDTLKRLLGDVIAAG